jgi:hypothetical protein
MIRQKCVAGLFDVGGIFELQAIMFDGPAALRSAGEECSLFAAREHFGQIPEVPENLSKLTQQDHRNIRSEKHVVLGWGGSKVLRPRLQASG